MVQLLFTLLVTNCFGQQVQIEGLDVRTVVIDDITTVHAYIDQMNRESINNHIESKIEFVPGKKNKIQLKSRELYNSEGRIIYKVDYGWNKGRDSATVRYNYDSIGRLTKAVRHNSIFGPEDDGTTLWLEYDNENRVTQLKTEHKLIRFYYNSNGDKDRIEMSFYHHYCFPSIRRPKTHVYDTTERMLYFNYNKENLLDVVLNSYGDTIIKYDYEQNGNLIKKNRHNELLYEDYYVNGLLAKSSKFEIQYQSRDTVLVESCEYLYKGNKQGICDCATEWHFSDAYSIEYIYNDKGLLIEKVKRDKKGMVYSKIKLEYEYY